MEDTKFDALSRRLSRANTRRDALRLLGGALVAGAMGVQPTSTLAKGRGRGNSACAQFCASVFGEDTPEAGQCTSQGARGYGLCYTCGPNGDGGQKLCGQACIAADACCHDSDCETGEACTNGQCVSACTPSGGLCDLANPGACCNQTCTNLNPPASPVCA